MRLITVMLTLMGACGDLSNKTGENKDEGRVLN